MLAVTSFSGRMWEHSCGGGKELIFIPLLIDCYTGHLEINRNHIHGGIINVISDKFIMAVSLPEGIAGISIYKKWRCGKYFACIFKNSDHYMCFYF